MLGPCNGGCKLLVVVLCCVVRPFSCDRCCRFAYGSGSLDQRSIISLEIGPEMNDPGHSVEWELSHWDVLVEDSQPKSG